MTKIDFFLFQKSKVSITGSIKQSQKRKLSERHCSVSEKIEVLRVALDSLGWNRKDTCDVITSRLQVAVPVDHLWAAKKCRNLKFTSVLGVLLTLGEVRVLFLQFPFRRFPGGFRLNPPPRLLFLNFL